MAARLAGGCLRQQPRHVLQVWVHAANSCSKHVSHSKVLYASLHCGFSGRHEAEGASSNRSNRLCRLPATLLSSVGVVRLISSGPANEPAVSSSVIDSSNYILPTPPIPDVSNSASEIVTALNSLGEPTLQSIGLGSFWPAGLVQQGLELLHAGLGLPWWGSIVLGTLIVRTCMFPIVVKSQKMSINLANHMPTVQRLQLKFSQARQRGNMLEAMRYGGELGDYMKRNNVKPFSQLMMPMCQVPVFLSVFIGLRGMANLPVESMKTGGALWFTDLTIAEPFYGLPLMTAFTFWLTVEAGVDGISAQSQTHMLKWIMRAMPLVMLPFISNFPTAMLVYWFTSNSFSLVQVLFLKIPSVREFCKIPTKVQQLTLPTEKKGFVEGFREAYSNMKASQQVMERQRLDETNLRKAAHGPIIKTYKYNPKMAADSPKLAAGAAEAKSKS